MKLQPAYSLSSTNRTDFANITNRPHGLTRFACSEGKKSKAVGIVPVSQLQKNPGQTEKISYEHMFDSRRQRTERGKLHGAFVWDATNDAKAQQKRRCAKRYFDVNETIDMRDEVSDRKQQTKIDPEPYKSPVVPYDYQVVPKSELSAKEKSLPIQKQTLPVEQKASMKTEETNHHNVEVFSSNKQHKSVISSPSKSELKPKRTSPVSPPPHVC